MSALRSVALSLIRKWDSVQFVGDQIEALRSSLAQPDETAALRADLRTAADATRQAMADRDAARAEVKRLERGIEIRADERDGACAGWDAERELTDRLRGEIAELEKVSAGEINSLHSRLGEAERRAKVDGEIHLRQLRELQEARLGEANWASAQLADAEAEIARLREQRGAGVLDRRTFLAGVERIVNAVTAGARAVRDKESVEMNGWPESIEDGESFAVELDRAPGREGG